MMLLNHKRFCNKMICASKDISSKKTLTDILNLRCDLALEHSNLDIDGSEPIFQHKTLSHNDTPPSQVCLKMVERFRRYCVDTMGHVDRWADEQTDGVILLYPPPLCLYRLGGIKMVKRFRRYRADTIGHTDRWLE